ncbi:uncharacterized protein Z518_01409 [Rhinocladiella mackenziei CBS 650.93]|uniref:Rhinocladiella mackenziei CBS 650.93 unplaced genomic scaffold supercont1.1, whole genome shotgun sequence n=1 Tax=Rhinocladiella mackenziei CBS 650.93 TaxID=1442369 RepID=A0A0D2G5X0_9EURO|nr:uncharacterized protein Z518_01409 [Rhinocladiella mackenziei CBS 650.93]KIX10327.1 hypothetical protein Z518_01409 [Rhinocladiella mackenziei CBS 650.93]
MAPASTLIRRNDTGSVGAGNGSWRELASDEDFILESWSQGFMVGALLIMACITVANMRRGVLLHKFILVEQLAALSHGTFCFMAFKGYGWYLSSTAALLYCSWIVHNIVAWMKIRPFFCDSRSMFKPETGKWVRRIYLGTLVCTIPPIILQIYDNFRFFNNINDFYVQVRPYEPLFRDPWWVFTCITLFHVIRKCYGTGVFELIKRSPRFGILLCAICLSLIFTALDIVASIHNFIGSTDGINPWWKLSLVFKCLTDTIMLDDFKTELKRLGIKRLQKDEMRRQSFALVMDPNGSKDDDGHMEFSDALNVNPAGFQTMQNLDNSPSSSPMGRLRQDSVTDSQVQINSKECIGKAGKKISRLPGLKDFSFIPTKAKQKIADDEKQDDENSPPRSLPDRLSQMRQSLGVINYHAR